MKKTIGLVLAVLLFGYGFALGKYQVFPYKPLALLKNKLFERDDGAYTPSPRYQHKVSFYQHHALERYDWVFVGDSITEASDWHELFGDKVVANRGIGGDITIGVLNRMDSIINTQAQLAMVMIGVNDVAWGFAVEDIAKRHGQIVTKLQQAGMDVMVHAVLQSDGVKVNNAKIRALNERLRQFSERHQLGFLDLNPLLAPNGYLEPRYSADGVHLNGLAYKIWAQALTKRLKGTKNSTENDGL